MNTASTIAPTPSLESRISAPGSCPCGHDHNHALTPGAGHDRSIGNLGIAMIGGVIVANSYLLGWIFPDQAFVSQLCAVVGSLILAAPIFWHAVRNLCGGKIYMNELVALALLAAFAGSDFRTAGIISFFLLLSIIIESRTASGAQRSIAELIKLTPNIAHKLHEDGREEDVLVETISIGDRIRIRPGENFPIDGRIIKGESTVNQASITGESMPLDKGCGDEVFAGTQNLTGGIEVEVTRKGQDTTLGKVKDMILAAEGSKTPIVRVIDRYTAYYTPTVVMIAAITWWISGGDMNRVITFMIIACPCVVILATPSAVVAAVAAAARLGILIRNVGHLELAARIRSFVFDKTGTLTEGVLSVARLSPVDGVEPAELLRIAASAEVQSNHPTARALYALAQEAGMPLNEVFDFTEIHGKGVRGKVDGAACLVGRRAWIESEGIAIPDDTGDFESQQGMSIVHVVRAGRALGWIGFRDRVRKEAQESIRILREAGVKRCAMFTGDLKSVAEQVAKTLEIEEFRSECLPEDKVAYIREIRRVEKVAVIGDGVNDAPALAAGDLGIAMGAIGSDIAINSASIALMTNDLRRIPMLLHLSRKTTSIINQNLFMSMIFVFGGMVLSVFGFMTPIAAAALHTGGTLIVLFNSARLVRTGEELTLENIE